MLLGTMLVAGGGPWIVPFPIALILIEFKIRIEERFMTAEFPEEETPATMTTAEPSRKRSWGLCRRKRGQSPHDNSDGSAPLVISSAGSRPYGSPAPSVTVLS
jgi:hypothetical protein